MAKIAGKLGQIDHPSLYADSSIKNFYFWLIVNVECPDRALGMIHDIFSQTTAEYVAES